MRLIESPARILWQLLAREAKQALDEWLAFKSKYPSPDSFVGNDEAVKAMQQLRRELGSKAALILRPKLRAAQSQDFPGLAKIIDVAKLLVADDPRWKEAFPLGLVPDMLVDSDLRLHMPDGELLVMADGKTPARLFMASAFAPPVIKRMTKFPADFTYLQITAKGAKNLALKRVAKQATATQRKREAAQALLDADSLEALNRKVFNILKGEAEANDDPSHTTPKAVRIAAIIELVNQLKVRGGAAEAGNKSAVGASTLRRRHVEIEEDGNKLVMNLRYPKPDGGMVAHKIAGDQSSLASFKRFVLIDVISALLEEQAEETDADPDDFVFATTPGGKPPLNSEINMFLKKLTGQEAMTLEKFRLAEGDAKFIEYMNLVMADADDTFTQPDAEQAFLDYKRIMEMVATAINKQGQRAGASSPVILWTRVAQTFVSPDLQRKFFEQFGLSTPREVEALLS